VKDDDLREVLKKKERLAADLITESRKVELEAEEIRSLEERLNKLRREHMSLVRSAEGLESSQRRGAPIDIRWDVALNNSLLRTSRQAF